jgi:hypothetical protein
MIETCHKKTLIKHIMFRCCIYVHWIAKLMIILHAIFCKNRMTIV